MSEYIDKTLLYCRDCQTKLTPFEESKWNRLVDYWGGKVGTRKPLCRSCYGLELEGRKLRAEIDGKI